MKKIKFTAMVLVFVLFISIFAGCGKSGSNLKGEITLKKFLDSGPKVAFEAYYPLDKSDTIRNMYLFEDGMFYYIKSFDEYDEYTNEEELTLGEIAQMSDEELLEYVRSYKTLHSSGYNYRFEFDVNDSAVDTLRDEYGDVSIQSILQKAENASLYYSKSAVEQGHGYNSTRFYNINGNKQPMADIGVHVQYEENTWRNMSLLADVNGNLYFHSVHDLDSVNYYWGISYLKEYERFKDSDAFNDSDQFDDITPYDGRYGNIQLPKFTLNYDIAEMPTGEYTLHLISDNTGNQAEWEEFVVEFSNPGEEAEAVNVIKLFNIAPEKATIYDSSFTCFYTTDDEDLQDRGIVFRTGEDMTLILDNPGDKGIVVD